MPVNCRHYGTSPEDVSFYKNETDTGISKRTKKKSGHFSSKMNHGGLRKVVRAEGPRKEKVL